jgi:hypothetical protein
VKAAVEAGQGDMKARMDVFKEKLDKMDVAMKADQEKMESRNNWKPELRL